MYLSDTGYRHDKGPRSDASRAEDEVAVDCQHAAGETWPAIGSRRGFSVLCAAGAGRSRQELFLWHVSPQANRSAELAAVNKE